MRFFTNDRDEHTRTEEHPEHVQSEPVAVPMQRPASPWIQAPRHGQRATDDPATDPSAEQNRDLGATTPEEPALDERRDADDRTADDRTGGDRTASDRTGGDSAVGQQYADTTDRDTDVRSRADELDVTGSGDRAGDRADDRIDEQDRTGADRFGGAAVGTDRDDPGRDDPGRVATGSAVPQAEADQANAGWLEGRERSGDDDDARVNAGAKEAAAPAETVGGSTGDAERRTPEETALDDGGTFEDPVVVGTGGDTRAFAPTTAAAAANGQLPGAVAERTVGPLFAGSNASGFRDRWREVQLRFVDDPKAAAAEAAVLVDEVVDALTVSLKSQRATLGDAEGDADTETLRVRLRAYRDFLDRLLAL